MLYRGNKIIFADNTFDEKYIIYHTKFAITKSVSGDKQIVLNTLYIKR